MNISNVTYVTTSSMMFDVSNNLFLQLPSRAYVSSFVGS